MKTKMNCLIVLSFYNTAVFINVYCKLVMTLNASSVNYFPVFTLI